MVTYLYIAALLCCMFWVFLKYGTGVERFWARSGTLTLPPDVGAQRRRSDRLSLLVPIHVSGQDVRGVAFEDDTHTRNISCFGAAVILSRQLRPGQEIVISRKNKQQTATCRVVYEMDRREGRHAYGVSFVDPNLDMWGVCSLLTEAITGVPPGVEQQRRTERVTLVVPILVTGQDVDGKAFEEETHTSQISGYGASVVLRRQVRPGQEIVISREDKSRMATCRVVYEMDRREGVHTYGVTFVDQTVDFWGVCDLLTEAVADSLPQTP